MKIEDFLEQITSVSLSQAQAIFSYWDEAVENYILAYKSHSSSNVLHLSKMIMSLGELVDLYRGVVQDKYPVNEDKIHRYKELLDHFNYKNGMAETLFERITMGSKMEDRLYFTAKLVRLQETLDVKSLSGYPVLQRLVAKLPNNRIESTYE